MSEIKNYLQEKLDSFNNKHNVLAKLNRYDGEIKRQWKRDREKTSKLWQEVKSITHVQDYIDRYVFLVEQEEKLKTIDLYTYDVDIALYRAVYSIQKMIRCLNMDTCDFSLLDKDTIDTMFVQLSGAAEKMDSILLRRTSWN